MPRLLTAVETCLLEAPALDAAGHMGFDEALLSRAQTRSAEPVFGERRRAPPEEGSREVVVRLYRWAASGGGEGPAATFGFCQRWNEAAEAARARGMPLGALVRRPTAGGVVVHDGDVTFSVVFPWGRLTRAAAVYRAIHGAVGAALAQRGVALSLWPPPPGPGAAGGPERRSGPPAGGAEPRRALACFPKPSPLDLVGPAGAKVLGGALRRRGGAGLYQGSLRPEGLGLSAAQLGEAVAEGAARTWSTSPRRLEAGPDLIKEALRLREERYATDQWNRRR